MQPGTQRLAFARRGILMRVAVVAGALMLVSACSSTPTTSGSAAAPPAASTTAPSASPAAAVAASPAAAVRKVNANTASQAEIQQALEAAGVPNAARWAREVDEYRPYPTDDPSFAKLRRELAKYNPGPGVVDQIVATLTL